MSEDLTYKLFTPTDCISEQTMFDYIDHKLSAKEQHAVEKHLLDCEFCSDALEGLRMVKNRSITGSINKEVSARLLIPVQEQEEKKAAAFNYRIYLSIAAGLLLLLGGVFFFNHFSQNGMKQDMAELKTEQKNQGTEPTDLTPPPPPATADTTRVASTASPLQTMPRQRAKGETAQEVKPGAPVVVEDEAASNLEQDVSVAEEKKYKAQEGDKITLDGFVAKDQQTTLKWEQPTTSSYSYSTTNTPKAADQKLDFNQDKLAEVQVTSKMSSTKKNAEPANKRKDETKPGKVAADDASNLDFGAVEAAPDAVQTAMTDSVYALSKIDQQAAFPGGQPAMLKFISNTVKWPEVKANEEISRNKIYVQFVVDKDGKITQPKILRGINPAFDKEALRIISLMPNWIPAKREGKRVASLYTLPITIELK